MPPLTARSTLPSAIVPVTEPGGGDRVGDEREPARRDAPQQPHDVAVEVHAVDDRLHDHVRPHERRADDAGVAMRQRPHRVEDVGDRANAAIEGGVRLGRSRVRVAEGDDDSPGLEHVDELERPGQLGRERHHPHRTGGDEPLEQSQVGIAAIAGGVGAEPARREERAFEVRPEHARATSGRLERNRAQRGDEIGLAGGDERRLERGHPGLEQRVGGLAVPVRIRAEEVDAREAVHLQVDEARDRDAAAAALEADRDDDAVLDLDVARLEPAVDEARLHAQPHCSSAFRTTPLTPSSRCSRLLGVDAGEQRDDRDLRVAAGGGERLVDLVRLGAGRLRDDAVDAGPELVVRRDDVDHEVAVGLARGGPSRSSRSC